MKFKQPSLGTNAAIFLPFLMSCTLQHFRIAELGCLASIPLHNVEKTNQRPCFRFNKCYQRSGQTAIGLPQDRPRQVHPKSTASRMKQRNNPSCNTHATPKQSTTACRHSFETIPAVENCRSLWYGRPLYKYKAFIRRLFVPPFAAQYQRTP